MKKLTTLLMALMLMSSALWADETITVSAKSTDISEGLDLKVVAKLFAEAKNLEEFETMLNNPDSAFCNLDLNGDGQVDYLRVVETGEGNKRLIVLQAVLAKDIYQDVASIYVEKDDNNQVFVQVIGDEYIYGVNYIIEPVYVYRPLIYDWFWCDGWYAWHSPWYWGYYPGWWYAHNCWAHDWYWHHCYAYHTRHYYCSFRTGRHTHAGYTELRPTVTRSDYAVAYPDNSFSRRNADMTNAREIRGTTNVRNTRTVAASGATRATNGVSRSAATTTATRSSNSSTRSDATTARATSSTTRSTSSTTRSTASSSSRSAATGASRPTASTTRSTSSAGRTSANTTRTAASSTRSTSNVSSASRSSSYSGGSSRSSSSYSGGSSRSSSSYSGGSSRSSSSYSGGSSSSSRGSGTTTRR